MIIGYECLYRSVDGFVYTRWLAVRLRESGRFSARNGRTPVLQWETPSVEEAHKPEVPIGIGTSGLAIPHGGAFGESLSLETRTKPSTFPP